MAGEGGGAAAATPPQIGRRTPFGVERREGDVTVGRVDSCALPVFRRAIGTLAPVVALCRHSARSDGGRELFPTINQPIL